jgi:hypothetical protein
MEPHGSTQIGKVSPGDSWTHGYCHRVGSVSDKTKFFLHRPQRDLNSL